MRFWKRGNPKRIPPDVELDPLYLEPGDGPPKGPENIVVRPGLKVSQAYWDLVNGKWHITP